MPGIDWPGAIDIPGDIVGAGATWPELACTAVHPVNKIDTARSVANGHWRLFM